METAVVAAWGSPGMKVDPGKFLLEQDVLGQVVAANVRNTRVDAYVALAINPEMKVNLGKCWLELDVLE
jgi:hypothetical protein